MKRVFFKTALFLLIILSNSLYAKEFKFDFGMPPTGWVVPENQKNNLFARIFGESKANGKVNKGYIAIHPWSVYDTKTGYGWLDNGSSFHGRPYMRDDILGSLYYCQEDYPNYELIYDGITLYNDKVHSFKVDLEPAKYLVSIYLGDLNLGEYRKDMTIKTNGITIVDKEQTNGGQVKRIPCVVDVDKHGLVLSFESTNQLGICGLEIRPYTAVDADQKVVLYPDIRNNGKIARGNLKRYITEENIKLIDAKEAIKQDGIFGNELLKTPFVKNPSATQIYATMYGDISRLVDLDPTIDITEMSTLLKNTGIDMINAKSPVVINKYRKEGLFVSSGIHAERFPSNSGNPVMQQLLKSDGSFSEMNGFFSIHSAENHKVLRNTYQRDMLNVKDDVDAIFVDEPRGMTFVGGKIGDYSSSSKVAFANWCNEQGHPEYAKDGIPRPNWSDAFYVFYLFRLESVPLYLNAIIKETCIENKKLFAGNGDISPGTLNHSTYFPPFTARKGIVPLSWSYTQPYLAKLSGEAMKAAQLYGENGMTFTRVGNNDEAADRLQGLAALSSRCKALGPREGHSFRLFLEFSKIAESLQDSKHTTELYLYWPQSLVYPDLINWNKNVGDQWNNKAQYLFNNNIDYKISYDANLLKGTMLLYYTPSPVLTQVELNSLKKMLEQGGTLLYVATTMPLKPDGSSYGDNITEVFGKKNAKNIINFDNFPTRAELEKIAESKKVNLNVNVKATKPITTYEFEKNNGEKLVLIINRSAETVTCNLEFDAKDFYTNERITPELQIKGGLFKLLIRK